MEISEHEKSNKLVVILPIIIIGIIGISMNRMVGKTGAFSDSTPMNIEGITVYFVSGLTPDLGLYHYFYAKGNRVFWIQVDSPDESYRIDIIKESIKQI